MGRLLVVASVVVVAVAAWLVWITVDGRQSVGPSDELIAGVGRGGELEPFAFAFTGGGTRVLDCMQPHRRFGGVVDPEENRAAVWLGDTLEVGEVVVIVEPESVLLHRALFDDPAFTTDWLTFARPLTATALDTAVRLLGPHLTADVAGSAVPPSGDAIVRAALEAAVAVERIGSAEIDGRVADGYRIEVEPDRLPSVPERELSDTSTDLDGQVIPLLEVWAGVDGDVVRVVVRSQRFDGTIGPAEDGWSTRYQRLTDPLEPGRPAPTDVTDATSVDLGALRRAPAPCELPI